MEEVTQGNVTISIEEFDRLRSIEKNIRERAVVIYEHSDYRRGYYGEAYMEFCSESDALKRLELEYKKQIDKYEKESCSSLKFKIMDLERLAKHQNDWIKYLLNRGLFKRILNRDEYPELWKPIK